MDSIINYISDFWNVTLGYFFNPGKRINVLYLFSSLLIAYYVFYKNKIKGSFIKYVFNKKVWLSKSAAIDYEMFLFNGLVKLLLIVPYIYLGFHISFYVSNFLTSQYGYMENPLSYATTVVVYTIVLTVVGDFFSYLIHLAMHKIPFLWEFHKIHHSATTMNPITQYRIHPIELIINNIKGVFVFGTITGLFNYLSSGNVGKWVFLGANVFSVVFFIVGANLRHSHVKFRYFHFLEYIFISPVQHQIHHSKNRRHWNKNMGSRLAIWDWLFGTIFFSKNVEKLSFGISNAEDPHYKTFMQNMLNPFINNYKKIINNIKYLFNKNGR